MNYLIYINRWVLAFLWAFLAYNSLFPIEVMELEFYGILPLNWYIIPFVSRVFVGILFCMSLFLLINQQKRAVRVLNLFFVFIFALDLWLFQTGVQYAGIFKIPVLDGLIYLVLLIACSIFYFWDALPNQQWSNYLKKAQYFTIMCIVLPFILNPIYPEDFTEKGIQNSDVDKKWAILQKHFPLMHQGNKPVLYAFFSTSCGYCKVASRKLQKGFDKNPNHAEVKIIYWGDQENVNYFQQQTQNNIPFEKVEDQSYPEMAGNQYPSYIWIDENQKPYFYTGSSFNYYSFQKMHLNDTHATN